jgi:hypothetical protein
MAMVDYSQIQEPVTHDDLLDHEELLESTSQTMKALFDRCRYQFQGDTPVSAYLWGIYCKVEQAHAEMTALRSSDHPFPRG